MFSFHNISLSFSLPSNPSVSASLKPSPASATFHQYTKNSNTPSHYFEQNSSSKLKVENFAIKSRSRVMGMNPNEIGGGGKKKKGKEKIYWVCSNCGYSAGQWWGVCRSCSVAGTMKEFHERKTNETDSKVNGFMALEDGVGSWLPQQDGEMLPLRLAEVNRGLNHMHWRIPLHILNKKLLLANYFVPDPKLIQFYMLGSGAIQFYMLGFIVQNRVSGGHDCAEIITVDDRNFAIKAKFLSQAFNP